MFNEGVDIPDVSTILMLRPTDSLTIFIQQIGRGLRLSDDKECLKVLDFIGNYRTSDIILNGLNLEPGDFEYDEEKVELEQIFNDISALGFEIAEDSKNGE